MAKGNETAIANWDKIPAGILPPGETFKIHEEAGVVTYAFDPLPTTKANRHDTNATPSEPRDDPPSSAGEE